MREGVRCPHVSKHFPCCSVLEQDTGSPLVSIGVIYQSLLGGSKSNNQQECTVRLKCKICLEMFLAVDTHIICRICVWAVISVKNNNNKTKSALVFSDYFLFYHNILETFNHTFHKNMDEGTSLSFTFHLPLRRNPRKVQLNQDRKHQYRKAESLSRAPFCIFSAGQDICDRASAFLLNSNCTVGNQAAYGPKVFCNF